MKGLKSDIFWLERIWHKLNAASSGSDADGSLKITPSDNSMIDAFGRIRMSTPYTLFDSSLHLSDLPLYWEPVTSSGGTVVHNQATASATLTVTGVSNSTAIMQTKQYFPYQPGKSQLALLTFTLGTAQAGVRRRVGYFDNNNGIFLEQTGDGLFLVRRTDTSGAPVDTRVAQANWNVDKFDGTGASGVNLNPANSQIFWIDLEWLGVGRVRCGFVINGLIYYAHDFNHANLAAGVYMATATLPLRYEINNTDNTGQSDTLTQICASINSEGGVQPRNLVFARGNNVTTKTVSNAWTPLFSIRVGTEFPSGSGSGVVNRETVRPIAVDILSVDQPIAWRLLYNPTLAGSPSWLNHDTAHSGVQYDVSSSGAPTGGVLIGSGYVAAGRSNVSNALTDIFSDLKLTLDFAGTTGDILTVIAQRVGASNSAVSCSITWEEIY